MAAMLMPEIGWIGLGRMGLPMCERLLQAGYRVVAYDKVPAKVASAALLGVRTVGSASEVCRSARLVCSMVLDDDALRHVVLSVSGCADSAWTVETWIDFSTVSPNTSAHVANELERSGALHLRCPVSGTVSVAERGELSMYVSGARATFEACLPVLRCLSTTQTYVGEHEEARLVKLAINHVLQGSTAILAEAVALGARAGLDRSMLVDAINTSVVASRHSTLRADAFKASSLSAIADLSLTMKDASLILELAEETDSAVPIAEYVRHCLGEAAAAGLDNLGVMAIAKIVEGNVSRDQEWPVDTLRPNERKRLVRQAINADDRRIRAMLDNDLATLDAALDAALVYTHSDGRSESKAQYMTRLRAGEVLYTKVDRKIREAIPIGCAVILHGEVMLETDRRGTRRQLHNIFQCVWVARPHGLAMAAWASTPLPQA